MVERRQTERDTSLCFRSALLRRGHCRATRTCAPVATGSLLCGIGRPEILAGLLEGYIRTTAAVFWGLMPFVYGLSHAYILLELPSTVDPSVGHCVHFLFLILLTEINDIIQSVIGRSFGKH